ncbi:unnamed protein product, partial [Ectocarpus sp. 12 AP-2014]
VVTNEPFRVCEHVGSSVGIGNTPPPPCLLYQGASVQRFIWQPFTTTRSAHNARHQIARRPNSHLESFFVEGFVLGLRSTAASKNFGNRSSPAEQLHPSLFSFARGTR